MHALGRRLGLATLCVATILMVDGTLQAQSTTQPRSTTNPNGGLRGNSERGLATRGASSRGISGRTTARPPAIVVAVEPEEMPKPPTATPASPAAPAAPAPRAPKRPAAAVRPRPGPDKTRPRLITVRNGPIVRGSARLDDGAWKVRTRDGLLTIPETDVVRTALESEILAEVRKRRRGMDRDDPAARLHEARWMLDLGLVDEAFEELDELLERDDAEGEALALLMRADLPPRVPLPDTSVDAADALTQLLDFGAQSTPSMQELVIQELVPLGARHRNQLERMLLDRRDAQDPAQRAFGERAMRRLFAVRDASF